jgi:HAD superfamily phosphatase (TIGR01668 family)
LTLRTIADLNPDTLRQLGNIQGVIFDLDDTIKPLRSDVLSPEMVQALKTLQDKGFQLGIVSNNPSAAHCEKARQLLREQGLQIPFIAKARKPTSLDFQTMLKHFALPPEQVVMIGDSPICDVVGGKKAGMKSIRAKWFTNTKSTKTLAIVGDIVNTMVNCSRTAIRRKPQENPILDLPVSGQIRRHSWLA